MGQPAAVLPLEPSKTDASCFGTSTGSVTAGTVTGAGNAKLLLENAASSTEVGTRYFYQPSCWDLYGNSY
jgi:hypothetical protein